jgi:hypothetical protein
VGGTSSQLSRWDAWPNSPQFFSFCSLRMVQIPAQLQIQPEVCRHSEVLRQPQRRARDHASTAIRQFIDPLIGHMDGASQFALGNAHWSKEFFQKHFTGMSRRAVSG